MYSDWSTFAGVDERSECSNCYEKVRNLNGSSNTTGAPTPLGGPYTDEGDREGDWCSDTNPHDINTYDCGTSSNPNGVCDSNPWANAPVNNHMSYSFCSSQFTDQQMRRAHCMADSYLGSWMSFGGGICGSQPPAADFVASPTVWQAPSVVNFTDLSQPSSIVASWAWKFDVGASNTVTCIGCTGTDATFVGQNPPAVTYPNAGLYSVSLTVTSPNGNDTETKVDYITVNAPAGDCDTLDTQWETPAPTIINYGFGGGWITGVPDPVNSVLPTDPKGIYESYFSPNPGTTPVGAVRVGLGSLYDPNDDMRFQVIVYDDDGAGAPGASLGGVGNISPTQLGVPGFGAFSEIWIPMSNAPIPTTSKFHVGVEIFAGDAADTLLVVTSCLGPPGCPVAQGENDASNHIWTSGYGYENLQTVYGADFDVAIVPMLGGYDPLPIITDYTENVSCDTTYVTLFDTAWYSVPTGWTFTFADGTVINSATDPEVINRVYTTPGPDTVTVAVINECGRTDTTIWTIPYNFLATPSAEFSATQSNPICAGAPGVDFAANTSGYSDYFWDFGDGNTISTGGSGTVNHVYAVPGTYYVGLTVTEAGFLAADTFYLEDFENGWPAGYDRYNNDAFTPNTQVNPPFTGTNATAWLDLDFDQNGDTEAVSTSWNGPGETADDWMLTNAIGPLPANQRLFWNARAGDVSLSDGYEVRISTVQLPANTTNYSTVLYSISAENAFETGRSVDLSAYAGQTVFVAFRNNTTDNYLLYIDDIRVGTATAGCSTSLVKPDYIEVVDCTVIPPTAVIVQSATSGCVPSTVTFTDGTSAGDPPISWFWNFGDGTFSSYQNPPPHLFNAGIYYVSMEACNDGGCTTDYLTLEVLDAPTASSFSVTDCYSYTVPSGNATYTTSGVYNDTIPNAVECDSVMTITLTVVEAPTITGFSNESYHGNTVEWSMGPAPLESGDRYVIRYHEFMNSPNFLYRTVPVAYNSGYVNNLTPDTRYVYRVGYKCAGETSAIYSDTLSLKTKSLCATPTSLSSIRTGTSAVLGWDDVNSTSYKVRYRPEGTSTWSYRNVPGPATGTTITGLTLDTYEWQIRSICGEKSRSYSPLQLIESGVGRLATAEEGSFLVFPNPVVDILNLRSSEQLLEVTIYDATGKVVMKNNEATFSVAGLPSGVYSIHALTASQFWSGRFVKN